MAVERVFIRNIFHFFMVFELGVQLIELTEISSGDDV